MVAKILKEVNLTIKFGGGLHTRATADDIDAREAAGGSNFLLDLDNRDLRNRKPFDLVGTAPNAAEIRGGGSLLKSDGTVTTLFQAGNTVYQWDGQTTFTSRGTVNSTAKLRGHWRSHTSNLNDVLLLTDLSLVEVVKSWNGTALSNVAFVYKNGTGFGTFYAKYLAFADERAIYANVKDPGATSRHMIVGSERSDHATISVTDRPISSLSEADPFFLLMPDLKPINGMENAFGTTILSTEKGRLFRLTGASAKDFAFKEFFAGSAAAGDEAVAYIGNDVIYGRQGRIESVNDTDTFGNSEVDDLTANIADVVGGYTGWRIVFNSRNSRAYLFPTGQSEVWVLNTAMRSPHSTRAVLGNEFNTSGQPKTISPWMRWRTNHTMALQPTFAMSMLDPADGLEYVFMGDANGNIYRMEGSGAAGDGGNSTIDLEWLTRIFSAELDTVAFDVTGYIKYHKNVAATVTLVFEYGGMEIFDRSITINIPAVSNVNYWGGNFYWNGDFYWGSISGRLARQIFKPPGQANEMQVRIKQSGVVDLAISEIGLRFREKS